MNLLFARTVAKAPALLMAAVMVAPLVLAFWPGVIDPILSPILCGLGTGLWSLWLAVVRTVAIDAFPDGADHAGFMMPWMAIAISALTALGGIGLAHAGEFGPGALRGMGGGIALILAGGLYASQVALTAPSFLRADLRTADLTAYLTRVARDPHTPRAEHSLMLPPAAVLVLHRPIRKFADPGYRWP